MRNRAYPYLRNHVPGALVISLVCCIIYANTLDAPFLFDDAPNIQDNPHIQISDLKPATLARAGFLGPSSRRPLVNVSFALNYYLGGLEVTGYHLINILIHLINGLLVYALSIAILKQARCSRDGAQQASRAGDRGIMYMSLFAALVFVSHPIQVQSVTYIVQRMNSMATLFYLLSFLLYIRGRTSPIGSLRHAWWLGSLVSWVLALGSKEIAATLPLLVFLYEWYFFQNLDYQWLKRSAKYLALALVLFLLVSVVYLGDLSLDRVLAGYSSRDFTPWQRVLTQFRVVVLYLSLLFYPNPSRLNLLHHIIPSDSLLHPVTTLFSVMAVLFLAGLLLALAKRQRIASFCILWFLLHLVIESSIIGLELVFEHRLYLPMVGFSILLSSLLSPVSGRGCSWVLAICALVVCTLSVATYTRNGVWQDGETFWDDVLSKNPHSHRAHNNLAILLDKEGRLEEAVHHYAEALRLKPNYPEAHNNLGVALEQLGRFREAIDHYFAAMDIRPSYIDACMNLGVALMRQGNLEGAVRSFHVALEIRPGNAGIYNNLGVALERQGKPQAALEHYEKALMLDPGYAEAHNNLGIALIRHGLYDEAIEHFSEALRLDPDDEEKRGNLELARQKRKEAMAGGRTEHSHETSQKDERRTSNVQRPITPWRD